MSSFIVNAKHIAEISKHYDALPHRSETFYNPVTNQKIDLYRANSKAKELPFKTVLAVMLGYGNLKGVNDRYPQNRDDQHDRDFLNEVGQETLKRKDFNLSIAEIINMIQCLNYQSMDANNYEQSDTSFILQQIKEKFANRWSDIETDGDENKITWCYPN